ncbi:MAG: EI24 domain-containing protein [Alphaproteobacteria bacterium]|nr:EI24 domain-containing protein [Alphaproteobacteria bacterium]
MGRILTAYFRAFGQLSDPKTRAVVWKSIGASLAIFVGLYITITVVLKATTFIAIGPLEAFFDVVAQFGVMLLTWFLFPAVVTAIGSLMLDDVVAAVEQRHYPALPLAPGISVMEGIGPALKFLGVTVGLNILCLPLLLTPLFPFVYYALNGYLISREYFELVAFRRLDVATARDLRLRWRGPLFLAGVGFAFMLTVPILNLIAPVIATAAMVHLFEAWRERDTLPTKAAAGPSQPAGPKAIDATKPPAIGRADGQ